MSLPCRPSGAKTNACAYSTPSRREKNSWVNRSDLKKAAIATGEEPDSPENRRRQPEYEYYDKQTLSQCSRGFLFSWCIRSRSRGQHPRTEFGELLRELELQRSAERVAAGLGVRFDHRHTGRSQTGFCVRLTWKNFRIFVRFEHPLNLSGMA